MEHEKFPAEIVIDRPTGPRISIVDSKSKGELIAYKAGKLTRSAFRSSLLAGAAAGAFLASHKWSIGSSAVLAVSTHLFISSMMMGMIGDTKPVVTAPAFTGPGDVVATALGWWGLRAFSAADKGNRLINICIPTNGSTCADVASDATTGNLVAPTNISGTDCTAVSTCTIKVFYDRSGANACSSAACDFTQNTTASRFTFTWNCQNGHPCAVKATAAAGNITMSGPTMSTTIPFTQSGVAKRITTGSSTGNTILQIISTFTSYDSASNTVDSYAGTLLQATANDNTIHAFDFVYNGASSTINVDGTNTNGNNGSSTSSAASNLFGDNSGINVPPVGNFYEFGHWPIAFNGTQQSNMNTNMRNYWGF